MYILPKLHTCEKCGYECKYSPHDPFAAPTFEWVETTGEHGDQLITQIICPKCYINFLTSHCGLMKPTR